jgi:hypothetical protein
VSLSRCLAGIGCPHYIQSGSRPGTSPDAPG